MSSTPLRFPTAIEYSQAIQNAAKMFKDPRIQRAAFQMNGPGRPTSYSGNFASTYVATLPDGKKYAVRGFLRPDPKNRDQRYRAISGFLEKNPLRRFARFSYHPDEMLALGRRWPIILMEWIDGTTLDVAVEQAAARRRIDEIERIRQELVGLDEDFDRWGCAHGDLNTGNVLVTPTGLRLVDYDGMFVPGMTTGEMGAPQEEGTPGTKHPMRRRADFGPSMDRFSLIAIDVSLQALAELPRLWKFNSDPSRLIFDDPDFRDPSSSQLVSEIRRNGSRELVTALDELSAIAQRHPSTTPTLREFAAATARGRMQFPLSFGARRSERAAVMPEQRTVTVPERMREAQGRVLERAVVDGSSFDEVRAQEGCEVDLVGRVHGHPFRKRDRHGSDFCFINFADWRRARSVKAIIWSSCGVEKVDQHLALWSQVRLENLAGAWIRITGTPEHYVPHDSMDIAISSPGMIRVIDEPEARRLLELSRLGRIRGRATEGLEAAGPSWNATTADFSREIGRLARDVAASRAASAPPSAAPTASSAHSSPQPVIASAVSKANDDVLRRQAEALRSGVAGGPSNQVKTSAATVPGSLAGNSRASAAPTLGALNALGKGGSGAQPNARVLRSLGPPVAGCIGGALLALMIHSCGQPTRSRAEGTLERSDRPGASALESGESR